MMQKITASALLLCTAASPLAASAAGPAGPTADDGKTLNVVTRCIGGEAQASVTWQLPKALGFAPTPGLDAAEDAAGEDGAASGAAAPTAATAEGDSDGKPTATAVTLIAAADPLELAQTYAPETADDWKATLERYAQVGGGGKDRLFTTIAVKAQAADAPVPVASSGDDSAAAAPVTAGDGLAVATPLTADGGLAVAIPVPADDGGSAVAAPAPADGVRFVFAAPVPSGGDVMVAVPAPASGNDVTAPAPLPVPADQDGAAPARTEAAPVIEPAAPGAQLLPALPALPLNACSPVSADQLDVKPWTTIFTLHAPAELPTTALDGKDAPAGSWKDAALDTVGPLAAKGTATLRFTKADDGSGMLKVEKTVDGVTTEELIPAADGAAPIDFAAPVEGKTFLKVTKPLPVKGADGETADGAISGEAKAATIVTAAPAKADLALLQAKLELARVAPSKDAATIRPALAKLLEQYKLTIAEITADGK